LKRYFFLIISAVLVLNSCKGLQKSSEKVTRNISRTKLLKEMDKHRFSAKTFESRIGISYQDESQSFNGNGKIRILKDSIIWGSINFLGIPMVKFIITPHRIRYYNKIEQEYYDGDLDLLRSKYGVALNFTHLQNLLLGDLPENLPKDKYQLQRNKSYYLLQSDGFQTINQVKITPFYKVLSEIIGMSPQEFAQVEYSGYRKVAQENIPEKIRINIRQADDEKKIQLEYKSPAIDKELRFPFKIPGSYRPIEL